MAGIRKVKARAGQIKEITNDEAQKLFKDKAIPEIKVDLIQLPPILLDTFYTKTQSYNKTEINDMVASVSRLPFKLITDIGEVTEEGVVYLLPYERPDSIYDKYILLGGSPVMVGPFYTDGDLSNYVTLSQFEKVDIEVFLSESEYESLVQNDAVDLTKKYLIYEDDN